MTIPIYQPAHLDHAERMANLGTALGLEVTLYCNSAAAREGALARGLMVVSSNQNVGYGQAANLSVHGKDFDWLIVCNDDFAVLPSDFARYVGVLADRPPAEPSLIGLSDIDAPRRSKIPGAAGVFMNLSLLSTIYIRFQRAWDQRNRRTKQPSSRTHIVELRPSESCPFMCVAINRSAWTSLGGFDPRFDLYFEDTDLLIRLWDLTNVHIAVMPARIHHLGSASSRQQLPTTLPVFAWSAYEYVILHTRLSPPAARFLVVSALAVRLMFVPLASSSPPAGHLIGIVKSVGAILANKRPRLPQWKT